MLTAARAAEARRILADNDLGDYTIPCKKLYPFQWNWDSVIVALGWLRIDEARAWREMLSLQSGQWQNGMIPHIIFHRPSADYFPGPDYWGAGQTPPTSAISQPPIFASGCLMLYQHARDKALARRMLRRLFPHLCAYHQWWICERSGGDGAAPDGLARSYHPWESGRDNSPVWDSPLAAVAPVATPYRRKDTAVVAAAQRPRAQEYDRYLSLVQHYKAQNFDGAALKKSCPYQVLDIGIIALLYRAGQDLRAIADVVGGELPADIGDFQRATAANIGFLWDAQAAMFCNYDLLARRHLRDFAVDSFLPLLARLASAAQAARIHSVIARWLDSAPYGLASVAPDSPAFEPQRYWRGPVWAHINWLIGEGLRDYGFAATAERIRRSTAALINHSGYAEYYDPTSAAARGGRDFSWPAAIALHWL